MLLEGDIKTSRRIFLACKIMYLNLKLPGSVLFCVRLGTCLGALQEFGYPALRSDSPFPQGVRIIRLMLKRVIMEKLFQTPAKSGPEHLPATRSRSLCSVLRSLHVAFLGRTSHAVTSTGSCHLSAQSYPMTYLRDSVEEQSAAVCIMAQMPEYFTVRLEGRAPGAAPSPTADQMFSVLFLAVLCLSNQDNSLLSIKVND